MLSKTQRNRIRLTVYFVLFLIIVGIGSHQFSNSEPVMATQSHGWFCDNLTASKSGELTVSASCQYRSLQNEVVEIYWGDGKVEQLPSGNQNITVSHTYAEYGTYNIVLKVWNKDKTQSRNCYAQITFEKEQTPCENTIRVEGPWSQWQDNGDGREVRSRTVTYVDVNDNNVICSEEVEYEYRSTVCQETFAVYGEWTDWQLDEESGREWRSREVIYYDANNSAVECHRELEVEWRDVQVCQELSEPVYGKWSEWTLNPDTGNEERYREVTVYDANNSNVVCNQWTETEVRPPTPGFCEEVVEVIGEWSNWEPTGDGQEKRTRTIKLVDATDSNVECGSRVEVEYRDIPDQACEETVEQVGPWSEWQPIGDKEFRTREITLVDATDHSVICGSRTERQERNRPGDNPPPSDTPETVVEEPAPVGDCYDPEFELEVRTDPETGYVRAWRIWTDDNGRQMDKLDLFRRFPLFDNVVEWRGASIERTTRCHFAIALRFEGSEQFDLFRFSSYGSSYEQLTETEDKSEVNPEWKPDMWIAFSEDQLLFEVNPYSKVVEPIMINGSQLYTDKLDSSNDLAGRLEAISIGETVYIRDTYTEIVYIAPFSSTSATWLPNMSGITWNDGTVNYTLDFGSGNVRFTSLGENVVWSPNQWLEGAAHITYVTEQRYWKDEVTGSTSRRTGEPFLPNLEMVMSRGVENAYEQHISEQISHMPIDWKIDPEMGQSVNMTPVLNWLSTLEVANDGTTAAPDAPTPTTTAITAVAI